MAAQMCDDVVVSPFSSVGYGNDWEWMVCGNDRSSGPVHEEGVEEGDAWEHPTTIASTSPSCFRSSISSIASDTSLDLFVARTTIRVHPDPFLDPAVDPEAPVASTLRRRSLHPVPFLDPELLQMCIDDDDCEEGTGTPPDAPEHPAPRTVIVFESTGSMSVSIVSSPPTEEDAKTRSSGKSSKFYYPPALSIPTLPPGSIPRAPNPSPTSGRPPLCPFSSSVERAYNMDGNRLVFNNYWCYTSGKGSVFRRVMERQPTPSNPDTTVTIMTALPLTLNTYNRMYRNDNHRYKVACRRHAGRMKRANTAQEQFTALSTFWRLIGTFHLYYPPPPRPPSLCFTLPVEVTDDDECVSVEEQGPTSVEDEPASGKATPDTLSLTLEVNLQNRG